jgi:hypothetical protein
LAQFNWPVCSVNFVNRPAPVDVDMVGLGGAILKFANLTTLHVYCFFGLEEFDG